MEESKKIKYLRLLLAPVMLLILALSSAFFLHSNRKVRRLFVFPSVDDGRLVVESRYLARNPVQGDIGLFVDELLLGSGVERTRLLFARGTRVNSCFLRGGILYLDLSHKLLEMGNDVVDIQQGVELLEKNVRKNFRGISGIELFVDGKYAYEQAQ